MVDGNNYMDSLIPRMKPLRTVNATVYYIHRATPLNQLKRLHDEWQPHGFANPANEKSSVACVAAVYYTHRAAPIQLWNRCHVSLLL